MRTMPHPEDVPPQKPRQQARGNRFTLLPIDDGMPIKPRDFLVEGRIPSGGTAILFGKEKSGKSFLALSLACSVTTGVPWLGEPTKKGLAIYVATEAPGTIAARVAAWKLHNGTQKPLDGLLRPNPGRFELGRKSDVDDLIRVIRQESNRLDIPPRLLVIDTLSRAIPGLDENNQADMSPVMDHCALMTQETGMVALLVHHVAKAEPTVPRGSSVIPAGVDTALRVSNGLLEVTDQRDGPKGEKIPFKLHKVDVPRDGGGTIDSCVAVLDSSKTGSAGRSKLYDLIVKMDSDAKEYFERSNGGESTDSVPLQKNEVRRRAHEAIYTQSSPDAKRKAFDRELTSMVDKGLIEVIGDKLRLKMPE